MGRFTVYSKDGQTVRCVLDKLEYTGVFMAERACTSTFISDAKINFDVFDYIDYRGERFELELLPTVKKISKHQYSYDLNFVSLKYELERCMMRNIVPSDNGIVYPTPLVVEFTGTVKYLAERIQACLDAMYGKDIWSITLADGVDSEEKNISMSNQNCWSALSLVNTEYKLNYFVKGRSVTIGGAEPVVNNVFEYGKGKGLYEIERISDADTGIVTKLRAYGGTRNLDYSYPKKPEWTDSILPTNYALSPLRLMLPSFKTDGVTDFVLASNEAIAKYGIREGVITYDDIYPSITGMKNSAGQAIDEIKSVDAITSETQPTFTVQLYDLGFDLNESLTTDEAQLSMKSGALQGYAFTITKIVKASDGSYTLTLGRNTLEEADTDNFTVPNKDWNMKAGDKFVLLNILMPQEYIRAAENRLLERAKEHLVKYSSTNYSYNIGVDEIFMARNANFYNEIMEGKRLTVNDPEMGIDHENVIIQSLSIKEGEGLIPTFEVTLNNEPSASTLERIQGQISEIETSVNNKFSSQSELSKQYRKKLDKVVWDRNLEERVDDNGKEYLFLTKPLITAYGVTMYSGADVQVPSIYEGLPIDGVTIQWVDGKLVATGGKGTANGIVVNGDTYTPNEDGIITLPNYPTSLEWDNISGKPSWIGSTKPSYSWDEIGGKPEWIEDTKPTYDFSEIQNKPTTLAGYGITDAYTKNDISGLLADYVTKSGAQDITGVKSFINGLNIGDILVKKHSDGVVELDGDLILTGSLTMFAQGSHTASTILDALPIDNTTLSKEGGVLSAISGVGGGSVDGIILNGTTYSPNEETKLITLPNYPTTLPASDVYSWAKQPNKPSYSFSELSSHPTTLGGYGITDAVTIDTYQEIYGIKEFATTVYISTAFDTMLAFKSLDDENFAIIDVRNKTGNSLSKFGYYGDRWAIDSNTILHTGNYAGELDNRYVNKAGDTMTGKLNVPSIELTTIAGLKFTDDILGGSGDVAKMYITGTGEAQKWTFEVQNDSDDEIVFITPSPNGLKHNNQVIFDNGNKRDMFSSMNEAFTAWGNEQVINVEGDANTYYPVVITIDGTKTWNSRISIYKNLGSRTPSYPGNHNNGTSSMWAMYEGRYHGWDGNSGYIVTKYVSQPYANLISKAEHAGNSVGALVVYLRGGGCEYRVCTDYRRGVNVYYERTEISGDSNYPVYVEPTTSVGNQGVLNMVSYDYLVQKAVRLETPRYIFSKPFDGTNNVTGGAKFTNICIETDNNGNDSGKGSEINNYNAELNLQYNTSRDITMCFGGGNVRIGTGLSGYKLSVNGNVGIDGSITFQYLSGGNERNLLYQQMADNDLFRIRCGGPSNQGWVEIATADDGTEPIYVRQYTGEFASITRTLTLLDGSGNTICPGNLLTNGGVTMYGSDETKKNIIERFILPLDYVVNAPLWRYTWRDNRNDRINIGGSAQYTQLMMNELVGDSDKGLTMDYATTAYAFSVSIAKHFQRFLMEDFNNHETRIEFLERENKELKDSNKEMMNHIIELERRAA